MKKLFDHFIKNELRISTDDKIVLTVSGGADSVAMLDLFSCFNFTCCVVHCNFHLRDAESDGDEKLVEKLAEKYHFPFYKIDFDTIAFASENGISIEMAARDLRYQWFEEIRKELDYQYIATAHHKDDVIETFFINLLRSSGIKGLSGIKAKKDRIIRPMLFAKRTDIIQYIKEENLEFREDSTNSDHKIIRNKLRHQIIPLLKEINPAANENIIKSIQNLQYTEEIYNQEIDRSIKNLSILKEGTISIDIQKLQQLKPLNTYLFEILKPYGFNSLQINDIENSLESNSGKIFYSKTHQINKDRTELIISLINEIKPFKLYISEKEQSILLPDGKKLWIQKLNKTDDFEIPRERNLAAIDMDKIKFPLQIREWEQGDWFYPLGMNKKKKLSDFFIDEKFSLRDKQKILLLTSDNQIVWLIDYRIDNRFKITENTKNILLLSN